jgi:ferritin-like metal-binding protein YciE
MAGVLDDADRDAGSHQPGPVLDIALVGAVRKAKAAEIVSYDTAIALARRLEDTTMAAVLEAGRASSIATDTALRERLAALTHSAASAAAD